MSLKKEDKPVGKAKTEVDLSHKVKEKVEEKEGAKVVDEAAAKTGGPDAKTKAKKAKPTKDKDAKVPPPELTNDEALKQLKTTVYDPRFPNQNQTRSVASHLISPLVTY